MITVFLCLSTLIDCSFNYCVNNDVSRLLITATLCLYAALANARSTCIRYFMRIPRTLLHAYSKDSPLAYEVSASGRLSENLGICTHKFLHIQGSGIVCGVFLGLNSEG